MSLSTHVLDAVTGRPAAGMAVVLSHRSEDGWTELRHAHTDADGRVAEFVPALAAGVYRLTFHTEEHLDVETFFPEVVVVFRIRDAYAHHHVPLLLSPYAYSTYRGS
jgi:5-hydroxyisourate hydrolase